jgi:hypothetical protein
MCPQVIDASVKIPKQPFKIRKLEAAERQLKQAIRLLFATDDLIPVHTLASAAHQILTDLSKEHLFAGIMRNKRLFNPRHWKTWIDKINEVSNFLKHADKDSSAEIEFKPFITHCFLLECVWIHCVLTGDWPAESGVFAMWMATKYPDFFADHPLKSSLKDNDKRNIDPDNYQLWHQILSEAIVQWSQRPVRT